jgi:Skp family chaperone for outer membrane proteins
MKGVVRSGILMAAAALLVAVLPLAAQQPAASSTAGKIAFVNARALLTGMPGYSAAESTFTKEIEAGRAEAAKLQAAMDSAVAEFEQQQQMLSPSNRAAKRKELETKGQQAQQKQSEIQQRLAQRERDLLAPMQERLTAVIEGIRAEGNYALIIDLGAQGNGIITYDKSLDITVRVAQRLKGP